MLKILLYLFVFVNFILLGFLLSNPAGRVVYSIEKTNVTKIIDGDTINTDIGKVRFLGINAPETNAYGYEEAKFYLSNLKNSQVDLIRVKENKDVYGRLLRYVVFQGKNINEEILRKGLAHLYYYEEDEFIPKLKKAEEQARKQELGIWEKSKEVCSKCIILYELNHVDPGEYVVLKNTCFLNCDLNNWTIKDSATHTQKLNFALKPQEKTKIDYKGAVWNDAGDTLYLRDKEGKLVLFYRY